MVINPKSRRVTGAPCTLLLKKSLRQKYEQPYDIQVFGFDITEKKRAERLIIGNPEIFPNCADFILIEKNLSKESCLEILKQTGIKLPVMYQLGYGHNNCIGCVKRGKGYWNKIRKDFPETFNRMAILERKLGYSINKKYLDEMGENEGRFEKEKNIQCDMFCGEILDKLK